MCNDLGQLNVKQVEEGCPFDFRGLRLDWLRLQVYCSGGTGDSGGSFNLRDHLELAALLNQIVFHTKMVDYLDDILLETSDLSIFCFFSKQFEDNFHMCLEFPAQNRFIISFPLICSHMQSCTHEVCPEEVGIITVIMLCPGEVSITTVIIILCSGEVIISIIILYQFPLTDLANYHLASKRCVPTGIDIFGKFLVMDRMILSLEFTIYLYVFM